MNDGCEDSRTATRLVSIAFENFQHFYTSFLVHSHLLMMMMMPKVKVKKAQHPIPTPPHSHGAGCKDGIVPVPARGQSGKKSKTISGPNQ